MTRVYHDPSAAGYGLPGHPEAPFRVARSAELLRALGLRLELPPVPASDADLGLVHPAAHREAVAGGRAGDPDTPDLPGMDRHARVSAGGALAAMRAAAAGEPAFSLMRPPGHHAAPTRAAGFCYYNNLAVAVRSALEGGAAARAAVIDFDVHHGDGTEAVFFGDERVRVWSLHQVPLYPGTGLASRGNCRNVPLPPGTTEARYLAAFEPALADLVDFKPDLLAVSAGFDAYKADPLAQLALESGTFRRLGALCAQAAPRRFAVLEGGYSEELPRLIGGFLEGFFG